MAGARRQEGRGPGGGPERPGTHNTALPLPQGTAKLLDEGRPRRRPGDDDNVGLWLDKFVYRSREGWHVKEAFREHAFKPFTSDAWCSSLGRDALARRSAALPLTHGPARYKELHARVQGRLLVDYGRASAIESALSFHHTWGVPRIPGSAVKGIALRAMQEQGASEAEIEAIFGTQLGPGGKLGDGARAGQVLFFDALPRNGEFKLAEDVLTPHHGPYYQNKELPGEWQSPKPHTFLTVVETVFVFHLAAEPLRDEQGRAGDAVDRAAEWLPRVCAALRDALEWQGIGAKTAAGYGRLSEVAAPPPPPDATVQAFAGWLEARRQAGATQRELLDSVRAEWWGRLIELKAPGRNQVAELLRKSIKSPKVLTQRDALLTELLSK